MPSGSVSTAERAGALLEEIVPSIQKTSGLVQEISSASQEQDHTVREINRAIIMHFGNLVRLLMHWLRPNREVMAIIALEAAVTGQALDAGPPVPASPRPP